MNVPPSFSQESIELAEMRIQTIVHDYVNGILPHLEDVVDVPLPPSTSKKQKPSIKNYKPKKPLIENAEKCIGMYFRANVMVELRNQTKNLQDIMDISSEGRLISKEGKRMTLDHCSYVHLNRSNTRKRIVNELLNTIHGEPIDTQDYSDVVNIDWFITNVPYEQQPTPKKPIYVHSNQDVPDAIEQLVDSLGKVVIDIGKFANNNNDDNKERKHAIWGEHDTKKKFTWNGEKKC
jgi:hypothetical protein